MSTNVAPAAVAAPTPAPQAQQGNAPAPAEGSPVKADATKTIEATSEKTSEPTKATERYEIKYNGKTKVVSKDELIRLAQLSEAATERFESAAQKERRANQIIAQAQKNPMAALMDPELGLTKEQVRTAMEEWYNREFIEPETLTKEQRETNELKRKLAEYENAQKAAEQEQQRAAQEKAEGEYAQHFQQQIIEAIEANKLPKTKSTVKRIAFYMRQAMIGGFEAPMELIIHKVRQDRQNEDSEINDYTYDDIVDRFGEEFVSKLISENLKRLREKRASSGGSSFSSKNSEPSAKKSEKVDMSEVTQRLKAMRLGK